MLFKFEFSLLKYMMIDIIRILEVLFLYYDYDLVIRFYIFYWWDFVLFIYF